MKIRTKIRIETNNRGNVIQALLCLHNPLWHTLAPAHFNFWRIEIEGDELKISAMKGPRKNEGRHFVVFYVSKGTASNFINNINAR